MYCPGCECEFRPGFSRCVSCDVELVESLKTLDRSQVDLPAAPAATVRLGDYCGYLELDTARGARDLLHAEGIYSELAIRAAAESPAGSPIVEEYWLRVDAAEGQRVKALLDESPPEESAAESEGFKCSKCDRPVREEESFCANCGTRFSE